MKNISTFVNSKMIERARLRWVSELPLLPTISSCLRKIKLQFIKVNITLAYKACGKPGQPPSHYSRCEKGRWPALVPPASVLQVASHAANTVVVDVMTETFNPSHTCRQVENINAVTASQIQVITLLQFSLHI